MSLNSYEEAVLNYLETPFLFSTKNSSILLTRCRAQIYTEFLVWILQAPEKAANEQRLEDFIRVMH